MAAFLVPISHGANAKALKSRAAVKPLVAIEKPVLEVPFVPPPVTVPVARAAAPVHYRSEFLSGLGVLVLDGAALTLNTQFRFAFPKARSMYLGVDGTYGLFAVGTILSVWPGLWFDFVLDPVPLAHLTLGVLAGPTFSQGGSPLPAFSIGTTGELSISFEIDDLSTVRGQFRSGIVGGRFVFGMVVLFGFRFR
jgi:hypothetical protein